MFALRPNSVAGEQASNNSFAVASFCPCAVVKSSRFVVLFAMISPIKNRQEAVQMFKAVLIYMGELTGDFPLFPTSMRDNLQ